VICQTDGDIVDETIKSNLPAVSFGYEANGKVYIHLDDTSKEIAGITRFNDRWHNVKIFMDNVYDRISVILDGVLVFDSIPRSPMAYFSPALSFCVGAGQPAEVDVDDVVVRHGIHMKTKTSGLLCSEKILGT
jgi:hypothetical protein